MGNSVTNRVTEFYFLLFGFMANFIWEMLQMPLFSYPVAASRTEINLACTLASMGDAIMLVAMFWITAALVKSRHWFFQLNIYRLAVFLTPGLIMTIAFEALATGPLQRWTYSDAMPTLPVLGTGIAPVLQWLVIPLFVLWLVRKQLGRPSSATPPR